VTLFLPWYQETVIASGKTPALQSASASLTGWGAFSFVEAAVLLVAVGVLGLLFARAEGRAFHVPGGDGGVITAAGLWTVALIVWRMFDKEGTTGHGQYATTSGIEWGIFVALGVAGALVYAGQRIRAAHEPEPPLPGERLGPAPRRGAPDARSATAPTPPTAPTTPGEPGPYVRKRPRFDVGPSGSHGSRPDSSRPDSPPPATPPPETPAAGQEESEIRPHRPRVSRDDAARRGLNFSDLDDIQFDAPPEPPGRIPRSPDPSIDPSPGRHTGPGEPPEGSEPPTIRRRSASGPPDDQLTIRLDGQE
jgi:hypothetical protein